jgi:hypothetical protein
VAMLAAYFFVLFYLTFSWIRKPYIIQAMFRRYVNKFRRL